MIDTPDARSCRAVRLLRYWRTYGRGDEDLGGRVSTLVHEGPLSDGSPQEIPFELEVPEAPPTYLGTLLSVEHYIEARVDLADGPGPFATERFVLEPGPGMPPPHPELIRITGTKARRPHGCRMGIGALLVLLGFLTMPVGLLLMAVGILLLVPVLRRGLAGTKLGEVTAVFGRTLVEPGDSVRVEIRIDPLKRRRIKGVSAVLRGWEVCTSGRGRDRKVHVHEVHSRLVRLSGARSLSPGEKTVLAADIPIPETGAYTFAAEHNEVTWDVTARVDIPTWPDWYEEQKLVVWPHVGSASAGRVAPALPEPASDMRPGGVAGSAAPPPPDPSAKPADQPEGEGSRARSERELAGLLEALSAEPPTNPAAGGSEALPELAALVKAVLAERPFGGARNERVQKLIGRTFDFAVEVETVRRTFGAGPDPVYRNGQTVSGTVAGTDVRVEVRLPASLNPEADRLRPAAVMDIRATVVDWEKLAGRPVLEAIDPAGTDPTG